MPNTRRSVAQQKEQRPKPCRPTEESRNVNSYEKYLEYGGSKNQSSNEDDVDLSWFDKTRLRVIAAAVYGFRCILTLEPGLTNKDLNFVHFLAKTTSLVILLWLEHAWGLYPGHLNVNSYLNIDIMRMDLHHSFDAGVFFFLPTILVLQEILVFTEFNASNTRTRDKKKFYEAFSDTTWIYNFYTAAFDQNRSIHRRNVDTSTRIASITRHPDKGGYTEHSYPFNHTDMQNIASHVHPFFVIANAYLHLAKLDSKRRQSMMLDSEALRLVWKIGQIWLRPAPPSFKDTKRNGQNAMGDPEKDSVSFLADTDNQGKVKYQKKEVFYRRLMVWADEQRSMVNVFAKTDPAPATHDDIGKVDAFSSQPLVRRRTRSSTIAQQKQTEVSTTPGSFKKRKEGEDDVSVGSASRSASKKVKLSSVHSSKITTSPARLPKSRGRPSLRNETDLDPAIQSYPSSHQAEVEDGTEFLLDFISSQITALRQDPRSGSSRSRNKTIDDEKIADIAFRVLEDQIAAGDRQVAVEDPALALKMMTAKRQTSAAPSTPKSTKKSSGLNLTSRSHSRSSSLTLACVEITTTPSPKRSRSAVPYDYDATCELETATELDEPADGRRGKSIAPVAPSKLALPSEQRYLRALSTPVETRSSSLSKYPKKSETIALGNKPSSRGVEGSSSLRTTRALPFTPRNTIAKRSCSPAPVLSPPVIKARDDSTLFLLAGQQMIFEALSKEFGLSVGEVSGVYKELGDLEKTKRVLAKILRPSDISLGAPRASSKLSIQKAPWSSPSSKKFVRSQSVAPSSSVSNFPPTPTRLFLSASKSSKRKVASSPSRPCEPFDDDNDADESDELLEVTRSKKRAKPTGLAAKPDFKKAKIAAEEQWTPESRLDSLTRSIELILRSGGLG